MLVTLVRSISNKHPRNPISREQLGEIHLMITTCVCQENTQHPEAEKTKLCEGVKEHVGMNLDLVKKPS